MEKWQTKEKEANDRLQNDANEIEKLTVKMNAYQKKISEIKHKIGQLGGIPSQQLLNQFKNKSLKALYKAMEQAKNNLKQYK